MQKNEVFLKVPERGAINAKGEDRRMRDDGG